MTTFSDMVYHLGGVPAAAGLPLTFGNVFFVDSGSGLASNDGLSLSTPLATIDQAINKCTASQGDVIVVLPGHAETISGATSLVMDVAGVQVVGLGQGALRPTLTFSATASIINVSAADCRLENLVLVGNIDDIVTGISIAATGDGCVLKNIEIRDGAANKEFIIAVAIAAAAADVVIDGFRFFGLAGGATSCIAAAGAADRLVLQNSLIIGDFSAAAVKLDGAASVGILIDNNRVTNIDTGAGLGIAAHASTTGWMSNNHVMNLKDGVVGLSGAAMAFSQNYGTNAAAASGIILPGVDS